VSERARVIELDAEDEVDLRSAWRRVSARWWLPLAGLVVGAALGVLVSVGGGEVYRAETLLYLGQPFTPQGGGQIQTLQTNPRTVSEIIRSESALKRAAADSGLRLGQLRGNVSSKAVVQVGQARGVSPLVEISVEAPAAAKAERAADSLATSVIRQASSYVNRKIELLERQIAAAEEELARNDARIEQAQDQLQSILRNQTIPLAERLLVSTNLNSTIGFAEQRRATVQTELYANQQLLSLARNVEKSDIVQRASASRETATSRRNAAVIGGLIGLLVGVLAAYVAEPVLARRNAASDR
jgi:capsular polysaccharide biosynthesis protein